MGTLVLDAGNTRLSGAVHDAGRWDSRAWVPLSTADPAGPAFGEALAAGLDSVDQGPVVLVSVIPAVTERVRALRPDVRVADHTCDLPFTTRVTDLAAVGPDRLCNLAAASAVGLDSVLVADLGTASTFDILKDGVFLGGLIAPGMAFAAEALGRYAARLTPVIFGPRPVAVGTDTASAMAGGAWLTGTGGVAAAIDQLQAAYALDRIQLTGGLGGHLATDDRPYDPLWTLKGALALCSG